MKSEITLEGFFLVSQEQKKVCSHVTFGCSGTGGTVVLGRWPSAPLHTPSGLGQCC